MIDTKQIFSALNENIIDFLIDHYESFNQYETGTMNKLPPPSGKLFEIVNDIIQSYSNRKIEYVIGNYYKHNNPYLPHTDFKSYQNNEINVVLPLQCKGNIPSLVVFDQTWELDSVTWSMHHKVPYFKHNIGVKGCPCEYPVENLTDKPIDENLYKYLNHYPKETLFGLSGKAYPFIPGSIIMFNNKKIHCTSDMNGEKIGLSLRYKYKE